MSIPLFEVVLGLTLILVLKWIWRRKQDLQKLQKLGYSVPPVSFIGGNLIELFTRYVTNKKKPLLLRSSVSTNDTPSFHEFS